MSFWVSGAIAVGGTLINGVMGSNASKSAARAQQQSSEQQIAEQRREYDTTRGDFAPYRQSGQGALNKLNGLQNGDMSGFYKSPDYNFRRTEGTRGINNSFAARGGAASGNALRALTQFSSNLAGGEFANYWNRLKSMSDQGLGATGQTAQAGQQATSGITNAMQQGGDARASGIMGNANAWGGALNTGLNSYLLQRGGYFNNPNAPKTYDMNGLPPG